MLDSSQPLNYSTHAKEKASENNDGKRTEDNYLGPHSHPSPRHPTPPPPSPPLTQYPVKAFVLPWSPVVSRLYPQFQGSNKITRKTEESEQSISAQSVMLMMKMWKMTPAKIRQWLVNSVPLLFIRQSRCYPRTLTFKPDLHCDISISTNINISITNVHTCCISTRKVTYASGMRSRMKAWEYGTRHVFKMAEDEILLLLLVLCRCQILFHQEFSYHGCIYFWDLGKFTYQC